MFVLKSFSVPVKTWVLDPALSLPKQMALVKLFCFIRVRLAYQFFSPTSLQYSMISFFLFVFTLSFKFTFYQEHLGQIDHSKLQNSALCKGGGHSLVAANSCLVGKCSTRALRFFKRNQKSHLLKIPFFLKDVWELTKICLKNTVWAKNLFQSYGNMDYYLAMSYLH